MPLFRRGEGDRADPRPRIASFWAWWSEHRDAVLAAAAEGRRDDLDELLVPAVAALDPSLRYAVEPAPAGGRRLVVTAGGRVDLLALAERWRASAPADAEVEFVSRRDPDPASLQRVLQVDGFDIDLAELSCVARVDRARARVDVVVHHPLFPLLAQDARLDVARTAVTGVLGEVDTERWLGAIDVSGDVALDPIDLAALPRVVAQLGPAARAGAAGSTAGGWVTLQGTSGRHQVRASVRRPFGPTDAPLCDTHLALVLSFTPDASGQPADPALSERLAALVAAVVEALGGEGPRVVVVGHEIAAGRAMAHLYLDGLEIDGERARPVLARWTDGDATMRLRRDPAYRGVGHLLA